MIRSFERVTRTRIDTDRLCAPTPVEAAERMKHTRPAEQAAGALVEAEQQLHASSLRCSGPGYDGADLSR